MPTPKSMGFSFSILFFIDEIFKNINLYISSVQKKVSFHSDSKLLALVKAIVEDAKDIAYIYESLHCNHFSLHSKVIDCKKICEPNLIPGRKSEPLWNSVDVGNVLYILYDSLCLMFM